MHEGTTVVETVGVKRLLRLGVAEVNARLSPPKEMLVTTVVRKLSVQAV